MKYIYLAFLNVVLLSGITHAQTTKYSKFKRAIKNQDFSTVDQLIDKGYDIRCVSKSGNTLLMEAVEFQNPQMVRFILEKDIDVNGVNNQGVSAVVMASEMGSLELVKLLTEAGADIENKVSEKSLTALGISIREGNLDVYKYLVAHGANLSQTVFDSEESYLSVAIINDRNFMLWDLIDKGINLEIQSTNGLKALHHALALRNDSVASYLLKRTENLESIDQEGKTALNFALETQNYKALEYLVTKTQINRRDFDGWSPLHYAVLARDTVAFNLLMDSGANADVYTFNDSISPLLIAAEYELDCFLLPMLRQVEEIRVPENTAELCYYSAYLHWRRAQFYNSDPEIFQKEKETALADFNEALVRFKRQRKKGQIKNIAIKTLTVAAIVAEGVASAYNHGAGALYNSYDFAMEKPLYMSDLALDIHTCKVFCERCEQYIEQIKSAN